VPLLWFADLSAAPQVRGVSIAMAAFAVAAIGFAICETVWFPLLHGYQENQRIGRFFGRLRTGWHLTLIFYFLGAQRWLAANPGAFAELFAVAFALGVLRVALIVRLPERSEQTGSVIHVREALTLLRRQPLLRRYLMGVAIAGSTRVIVFTFAIVMMRRVIGFSEGEVLYTTVAIFSGGLASLLLWGRVVDRVGPGPVFRWTAIGQALLFLGFLFLARHDAANLTLAIGLFFGLWALGCGFDVADTHVIFALAPADSPARTLVVTRVTDSLARGAAPLLVGVLLDRLLTAGADPLLVYRCLFAGCAAVILLAIVPLRAFRNDPRA
jgi:predicted MFS family arabinose efflux permease